MFATDDGVTFDSLPSLEATYQHHCAVIIDESTFFIAGGGARGGNIFDILTNIQDASASDQALLYRKQTRLETVS